MLGAGGEARTLDDELDRLGNTTRAMQDNTELLRMSWRELTAEFGSGAVAVRALTIAQTELQVSLARAELREHVDLFKEAASTYYATNNASRDYQNTLDRLVDTFGVSVAEARQLETLIQKVATSPFDEQEEALSQIVDFLAQAGVNLRDLPPALSLALSSMIEVARETERLEKAIADAEGSVDMAAKTTLSFAQNMERAYRAADSISGVDFKNLAEATRWGAGLWDGSEWINPPDMTPWTQPRSSFSRDGMSPEALTALARLEQASEKTFRVISDYRSPDENRAANGARDSQHMQGNAFDIDVSGMTPEQRAALIRIARREAGFGGVGVYQNSLHFDTGPTRAWGPSFGADSVPGWAFEATQTPRAGDAEATRAQAEAAREAEKAERDRERALDRSQNAYDRLRSSIDPAVAASVDFAAAQEVIREALENGQISAEEAAVAMAAVEREYQETLGDLASERVETMRSGFESLTSTLLRAAAAGDSVGEALRNFLLDAAIQAAARSLANTLTSLFSGGAGGGGGLLGSFVSSIFGGANAKGNVFDGGSVVAFARGGVVDSDTYFPMSGGRVGLMGEAGPEAIMPLTRGPDGKLGVHAQGGQAAQQQTATRVEVVPSPYFDVRVTQVSAPLVQSGMRASAQQFGNIASGYNERGTT
ncbi:MAG TPA: hypothetical protein DEB47_17780 [Citreicella sp.]|nr:hypothetical protein [Citreicella sp.]